MVPLLWRRDAVCAQLWSYTQLCILCSVCEKWGEGESIESLWLQMGYMTIKEKKPKPKLLKRSRQNEWSYSLQKIYCLSFFSLVLNMPCPVCSPHLSDEGDTQAVLPCSNWEYSYYVSQSECVNWSNPSSGDGCVWAKHSSLSCQLSNDFVVKASPFPEVSCRVMEWVQTSSSSFPKELLLHTPPVTQQIWGLLYPHSFCLIKNQGTAAIISK